MLVRTVSLKARLGALGCLVAMGAACMAAGSCGTDLHRAETASAGIAASLNTAATINHNDTFESPQEKQAIATYILQVALANDNFLGVLKAAESQSDQVSIPLVETALSNLLSTVNNLNAQGVLKLKSTQAQADFAVVMSSVQASLTAIETIWPPITSQGQPGPKPGHAPWLPFLAITLTPAEIDELIALVVAAGSSLVPKLMALKGETDAELIAGGQADDASAEAIARSDGADLSASPATTQP